MIDLIVKNASELITCKSAGPKTGQDLNNVDAIKDGSLAINDGKIVAVGQVNQEARKVIDASGKVVMPGFIDCHTHLFFAGSREDEFELKVKGAAYLDILKNGGGILSTVEKTRMAVLSEDELRGWLLFPKLQFRLAEMLQYGTTTVEIKSGYGLSLESELTILKMIRWLGCGSIEVVPTFLGAHAVPEEYKGDTKGYIQEVLRMIEEVSRKNLAKYCDVFVEKEAFSVEDAKEILKKAKDCGLGIKLHAGEFNDIGGAELGVEMGAVSVDHLDYISENGMKLMAEKKIIGVLLPGVPFHLMINHYAPARKMIEVGIPIALATDFNPGSCPTLSMQMIIALACRQMKLTPAEAINSATINAAYALGRGDKTGSLEVGKQADVIILDIPSHRQLPYWFGMNLVERVIKNGRVVK